ncbi:ATP-binding cassette domain-containing protein [Ensifer adhaerens]|uniref:branched-chain amino acid ABC transporter ATP-binding protein/permease n=1 Tax=Ensifer adhaerens TaxID=106592 RepID=UPI001CBED4A8|nr:ATP-binding cassette domain-containing protein [Ensifer adhaerens]MBZ7924232.1 ATP-binding cassette domain-containing protein [Ensifer adhaerens]UAX96514.1 ATP-binding cassette domain-containing protein [Ensifer adhaerens]UAY04142.1 ATP-binding cassette domain-containing protein [Ensifer adhaerens]UAY12128.1 ATP-binding cassette domain-containing protein [Ensifer adhaerens]
MRHGNNFHVVTLLSLVALGGLFWLPPYFVFLATTGVLVAIMVRSLGVVTDQAGLISLCHMTFAGIGAWAVCWLNIHMPSIPYILTLILGAGAGLCAGILLGLPALRLRGLNLAAITLTFAVAVDAVFSTKGFPGGSSMQSFKRPGYLADDYVFLTFCIAMMLLVIVGLRLISRSRLGASWEAIRYSERATASMGISVARAKLSAFAISAGIAGLVGGLTASQLGMLTSSNFSPLSSLSLFALAIFAGGKYWEGAIVAGLLSVGVPEVLRRFGLPLDLDAVIFAIGAIDALRKRTSFAGGLRRTLKIRKNRKAAEIARPPETGLEINRLDSARFRLEVVSKLEIADLRVNYGNVVAVDRFGLALEPGCIAGLVGPNGAGKSTIIDAITGFLPQATGTVKLGNVELMQQGPTLRARIGIRRTFQQGRSIPELTVGQYLSLSSGGEMSDDDIDLILAFLDCPPSSTLISEIEIGLRRLIEVAASLSARPRVLLLDEPAAGLSADQSATLAEHIARIPEVFGCSVLIVEHDMDIIRRVCNKIIVVDFGRVIAEGSPEEVLGQPQVLEAYLGAA